MNDWQVGDLALCVVTSGRKVHKGDGCRKGRIYRVIGTAVDWVGNLGIVLDGKRSDHPSGAFLATAFRKIRPDEHEACEPEFVTLLKRAKRTAPLERIPSDSNGDER
jgi:hypothetical protein